MKKLSIICSALLFSAGLLMAQAQNSGPAVKKESTAAATTEKEAKKVEKKVRIEKNEDGSGGIIRTEITENGQKQVLEQKFEGDLTDAQIMELVKEMELDESTIKVIKEGMESADSPDGTKKIIIKKEVKEEGKGCCAKGKECEKPCCKNKKK